jgi:hypothetical protein
MACQGCQATAHGASEARPGNDAREFLAGLASNIGLDKFRAVIKIKIK